MVNIVASAIAGNGRSAKVLEALVAFANTNKSSFVSFVYENDHAVTRYWVHLGVELRGVYERGLANLQAHRDIYINDAVQLQAIDEVIASIQNSLSKGIGQNDNYTKKDKYQQLAPNLKMDKETKKVYLFGLVVKKQVLRTKEPYKTVNSSEKTLAKKAHRKRYTRLENFREFILDANHFGSVSVNKNKITINSPMIDA
jgi:hypothetical protein